jgi:rhamnogalacturonyl hydrolase YesR
MIQKHIARICLASLCGLAMWPANARAEAKPAEAFASFTDDGGWCWFSNPRAVSRDGKTYTGWVTEDGSVQAAELEHATGKVAIVDLHAKYQRDDHDNPSFLFLPDGRLMAFYSRHGGKGKDQVPAIHSRSTVEPGKFDKWTPEVALPLIDRTGGKAGISYCNPHLLSEENNTIYLFWRGYTFKPTMAKSADGGKTWSEAQVVFSRPGLPPGNRPYAQYASNGRDTIHMLFTDGHPRNEPTNCVYYVCYRGGAFFKADGTRICGVNELPIRPDQADKVYDAAKTGARAWIWDIAFDKDNHPVIAYTRHPEETDHRYHYARWDGKQWIDTELCAGGKWFPQTPPKAKEPEPHYSSGLALDHENPSIVYLTRPVNGVRELERWTSSDLGLTWKSEAVTQGSFRDNIRPVVIRGHSAGGPTVLWQNLSGHYKHFTKYRCSILMDLPLPPDPEVVLPETRQAAAAMKPEAVLQLMRHTGDWQLTHNRGKRSPKGWIEATGYLGIMSLAKLSGDPRYSDAMLQMARENRWGFAVDKYFADNHLVGETYLKLHQLDPATANIAPLRAQFDSIIARPRVFPTLDFSQPKITDEWSWCDSLFMGPPVWALLADVTGDKKYLDFAVKNWWRTRDYLYDKEEHLYYRDSKFFNKREANGKKVFWSRGNGWVLGGLARWLEYLPKDHPDRPRFEAHFKELAERVAGLQHADGFWRASLLDPDSYPMQETSGTALFTFGLAWGINNGLLDRATYQPVVTKGWTALVSCVKATGKLTHVQPVGASPGRFDPESTASYGVGAFLLAGTEVHRMSKR